MSVTIQLRRDTAANWTAANPVLYLGEVGVETDTHKAKFGDGVTAWNSLAYWSPAGAYLPLSGGTLTGELVLPDLKVSGLTGATSATRFVGGTASGAPVSGTFAAGDFVIDQSGKVWICTGAGTPGSWTQAGTSLPLTTLGDTLYENSTPALARLPGNTSATKNFLTQTGTGSVSAAPAWGTVAAGDLPAATTSTQGAVILDGTASDIAPAGVAAAGAKGQAADAKHVHPYQPWQFLPEGYGAKGDGIVITDAAITSGQATLTTPGLAAPSAPTLSATGSGGTLTAGNYQVKITYVNQQGETTASGSTTQAISGSQNLQINTPAASGGACGWYAYVTVAGGSTYFRQQTAGQPTPLGTNLTLSANPSTSGANPPGANTTASNPFTSTAVDGGKKVYIVGAGAAGADYFGTISTVTNSGTAVLASNAGTTVSGKGCVFGTDDTTAINNTVAAAVSYAQANGQYAEVVFRPVIYTLASAASGLNATYQTNAIIPLPVISGGVRKVTLVLKGLTDGADALPHWQQEIPKMTGTCLAVLNGSGANDATYGPPFVIAGPWNGYGETGVFSNMMVVVDGVTVSPPWNGTYGGFGFWGVAEVHVSSAGFMALGVVPSGGAFPVLDQSTISNQFTIGLLMPAGLNNALCDVREYSSYGATYGLMPSEHCFYDRCRLNYNIVGVSPVFGGGNIQGHPSRGGNLLIERCSYAVGVYASGINSKLGGFPNFQIDCLSVESEASFVLHDPNGWATAIIGFQGVGYKNGYLSSSIETYTAGMRDATGVRLIALGQTTGPLSSPQAPPASGSKWVNAYYRDAFITLSSSGGTVTALTITGANATAQNIAAAATLQFLLPSGCAYTPTYTGTLSHTVTLL